MSDVPTGGILGLVRFFYSSLKEGVAYVLFSRAYEVSTFHKNHRQLLGRFPRKLGPDLEYDIHRGRYYFRERQHSPLFWIRSTGETKFSKATIVVTASRQNLKYQQTLILSNIDSVPTQTALSGIPFRTPTLSGDKCYMPYSSIETRIIELYDSEDNPVQGLHEYSRVTHPFDTLDVALGLKRGDIERWGSVYNLEFIESQVFEQRLRLIGQRLGTFRPLYYFRFHVYSIDWIVKAIFWMQNLVFARQLTLAFLAYCKTHGDTYSNANGSSSEVT